MASFAADIKTSGDHAPDKMHVNSKGETNQGSVSDNDGSDSEKPMRKKLEETTITQELNGDDHEDSASDDDGIDTKEQKGGHNKGSAVLKSDEHNATVEMDDEHGAVGDDVEPKTVSHDREWAKYGDMDADDEKTPHAKTRSRTRRSQGNEDVDQDSSADGVESKPGRYRGKRSRHGDIDTTETMAIDAAEDKSTESEERRMGTPDGDGTTRLGNVTSPRGKRNRAQYLQDEQDASPEPAVRTTSALAAKFMERVSSESRSTDDERVPKRHRSTSPKRKISEKGAEPTKEESTKLSATSGFANLSASSPFATLAGNKSPSAQAETSKAAFEASSFSKLAQSSTSGFGTLGASIGAASPFGGVASGSKLPPVQGSTDSGSAFGGLSAGTNSGFGMFAGQGNSLGFGGLTGGANPFGSNLSALSGPSGFAGNKPPIIGISAAKPFGAPAGEESEDADDSDSAGDDEGAEETGSGPEEAQKKDRHFHEQDVETGEEGEKTIFSSRAKLYYFDKEWKERGGGMLKLNITRLRYNDSDSSEEDDTEATPTTRKARLIMRADGSHRVMLNTAIVKQSPLGGDERGSKPTGGSILLQGMIDGRDMPVSMQLKMKPQNALGLWEAANEVKTRL